MIYLLFAGEQYYPGGGSQDLISVHKDKDEANSKYDSLDAEEYEWKELVAVWPDGYMTIRPTEKEREEELENMTFFFVRPAVEPE